MEIISKKENDAIKLIEEMNTYISSIREYMRKSPNSHVDEANRGPIAKLVKMCQKPWRKYNSIKNKMNDMHRVMLLGRTVTCWNGKNIGVSQWEDYFKDTLSRLESEVDLNSVKLRSKNVAIFLAFCFGWFGLHKFYTGHTKWGIIYLIFSWTLVPEIIALIECIFYNTSSYCKFNLKYCK